MARRMLIVAIALLLVGGVFLGALFGGLLTLFPSDYSTNSRTLFTSTTGPSIFTALGTMNRDPARPGEPEVLDAVSYVTSWKSTGNSESIEPQGAAIISLGFLGHPGSSPAGKARWKFFVSCASGSACPAGGAIVPNWGEVFSTLADNNPLAVDGIINDLVLDLETILEPAPAWSLVGSVDGFVRVELWGEWWAPGPNVFDGDVLNDLRQGDRAWLRDDAVLVSGRGTITSPTQLSAFEVGQTISIAVDVGSACSKKTGSATSESPSAGYTLELFTSGQGRTVKTWDLACGPGTFGVDRTGVRLEYVVQQADFSNAAGVCRNSIEIRLLNDLFSKDQVSLRTIDVKGAQPATPKLEVTVEGGIWEEGKAVTIKVITARTDATVNIVVKNKETGAEALRREKVAQFEFQFIPTVSGIYEVAVSVEVDCRASLPNVSTITIKEAKPPECVGCDGVGFVWPLWATLAIVAIILMLLGIFLPLPWLWRLIMIGMAAVLLLVAIASASGAL